MRLGVMSDSHGNRKAIRQAIDAVGAVDMWLHGGDYSQDAEILAEWVNVPVVAVAGNTDGWTKAKCDEFLEVGQKKIWITHGHRYQVKYNLQELAYWGHHYEVDLVIFGHTHQAIIENRDKLLLVNPGSIGFPNKGDSASVALLDITGERIQSQIIAIDLL